MKCKDCQKWLELYDKDVFCDACPNGRPDNRFNAQVIDTVQFPTLGAVSKKQVAELERRVILPYEKPGGGYYLGRRGENGKIQEKHPDYRP